MIEFSILGFSLVFLLGKTLVLLYFELLHSMGGEKIKYKVILPGIEMRDEITEYCFFYQTLFIYKYCSGPLSWNRLNTILVSFQDWSRGGCGGTARLRYIRLYLRKNSSHGTAKWNAQGNASLRKTKRKNGKLTHFLVKNFKMRLYQNATAFVTWNIALSPTKLYFKDFFPNLKSS